MRVLIIFDMFVNKKSNDVHLKFFNLNFIINDMLFIDW